MRCKFNRVAFRASFFWLATTQRHTGERLRLPHGFTEADQQLIHDGTATPGRRTSNPNTMNATHLDTTTYNAPHNSVRPARAKRSGYDAASCCVGVGSGRAKSVTNDAQADHWVSQAGRVPAAVPPGDPNLSWFVPEIFCVQNIRPSIARRRREHAATLRQTHRNRFTFATARQQPLTSKSR